MRLKEESWESEVCSQACKQLVFDSMTVTRVSERTNVVKREVRKGFRFAGDTCIEERSECDESKSC